MPIGRAASVRRARLFATVAVGLDLLAAALVASVGPRPTVALAALAPPAGLIGIVAPVIGYRLYLYLGETSVRPLGERFVVATSAALGITAGAAALGILAFFVSNRPAALIGLVTHVLLAGALWPSSERLESFDREAA